MRQVNFLLFLLFFVVQQRNSLSSANQCQQHSSSSSSSSSSYQCLNRFPLDRTNVEQLEIQCNSSINNDHIEQHERFYSIIQSFQLKNCPMKIFYLDRYTLWNYLHTMSITYAHLTRLSTASFNRSSPILYSIKSLNLSHNSLRMLNKNFSFYFPSLEKLDLSYNQLILIRKRTLINLIHLKELYLNNNRLKHIQAHFIPRQSLQKLNLNDNLWHCSCKNILILAQSRPLPNCHSPKLYSNQNVSDVARQCILYSQSNLFLTYRRNETKENFTCSFASTIEYSWINRTNRNYSSIISIWHRDENRSIEFENLWTKKKFLVCFQLNSTRSESISMIFPRPDQKIVNVTAETIIIGKNNSTFVHSFLRFSQIFLPKPFRKSNRRILIVWLSIFLVVFVLFLLLIFYLTRIHWKSKTKLVDFVDDFPSDQTLVHLNLNCQNHKCLCQYRRRAHSSLVLSRSTSSTCIDRSSVTPRQPSFIEPSPLRYAKIKRISSAKQINDEQSVGEFRTLIKLKNLPN